MRRTSVGLAAAPTDARAEADDAVAPPPLPLLCAEVLVDTVVEESSGVAVPAAAADGNDDDDGIVVDVVLVGLRGEVEDRSGWIIAPGGGLLRGARWGRREREKSSGLFRGRSNAAIHPYQRHRSSSLCRRRFTGFLVGGACNAVCAEDGKLWVDWIEHKGRPARPLDFRWTSVRRKPRRLWLIGEVS